MLKRVQLRQRKRLAIVEAKLDQHRAETGKVLTEHENNIRVVFEAIRQLIVAEKGDEPSTIGFETR